MQSATGLTPRLQSFHVAPCNCSRWLCASAGEEECISTATCSAVRGVWLERKPVDLHKYSVWHLLRRRCVMVCVTCQQFSISVSGLRFLLVWFEPFKPLHKGRWKTIISALRLQKTAWRINKMFPQGAPRFKVVTSWYPVQCFTTELHPLYLCGGAFALFSPCRDPFIIERRVDE